MNEAQRLTALIAQHGDVLRARGINRLYLFGSRSRDDHRFDSDIDLFCDIEADRRFSLFDLMDIEKSLTEILEKKVDLMSRASLHPMISAEVQEEAIRLL